jgi:hypothetical protein
LSHINKITSSLYKNIFNAEWLMSTKYNEEKSYNNINTKVLEHLLKTNANANFSYVLTAKEATATKWMRGTYHPHLQGRLKLVILPPSMSQLSGQCGIFNISQPYRPPRPVMGIALIFYM